MRQTAVNTVPIVETSDDIAGGHVAYFRLDPASAPAPLTADDGTPITAGASAVSDADVLAAVRENTAALGRIHATLELMLSSLLS